MPNVCRYYFARLRDGVSFCSEECEDGMWAITPTISGEVYTPEPEPQEPPPRPMMEAPPTRPALERPPEPWEAASIVDRIYLSGSRLHQHLIECNP
jgi:hypothetical protein